MSFMVLSRFSWPYIVDGDVVQGDWKREEV